MSYISQRTVKGKKYYYLEESFPYNGKLVKESVYFGSMYPSNDEIFLGEEVLKRTCLARNHVVLTPPLTEFIRNRTALILENKKKLFLEQKNNFSKKQISILKKKRIESLFNLSVMLNEAVDKKNIEKCINFLSKSLEKKETLTEAKIKKLHSILYNQSKKNSKEENNSPFMHLLFTWFKEKNDLIHPVEFAAKFCAKFYSLKPFEKGNTIIALIFSNYLLEEKELPPIIVSKKRFPSFIKALNEGEKENYKLITKFFSIETIKQCKLKLK